MGERDDYGDEPRSGHEPTLADRARATPDPAEVQTGPARHRMPVSAVVAFALFGVFVGGQKWLAEVTQVERLGKPWSLVVQVVVIIAVSYPLVTFGHRRLEQANRPPFN
jgi:hypothetical protein